MSKSKPAPNKTQELTHDDIKEAFLRLINLAEPDHPYFDDPYPLKEEDIVYGYKRYSGPYYASCGPRSISHKVSFKADKRTFNNFSTERVLAIYAHEMTHVTVGSHSDENGGSHPPRFFQELAFNAHQLLDNWSEVENTVGPVSKETFILDILDEEINQFNVDRRYASVKDYRHMTARLFKSYLIP